MRYSGAAAAAIAAVTFLAAPSAQAAVSGLSQQANQAYLKTFAQQKGVVTLPSGLEYKIIQNGFGKRPTDFDNVQVYYKGELINGKVFDSTEPGLPAKFTVNQLIPGWTEALKLMREGDHWQIAVPSNLAYGARGAGDAIPPEQTLIFDMELVKVLPPTKTPDEDKH